MSYSSERPATALAESLGGKSDMIYRWHRKYTPDGEKPQLAQQQDELIRKYETGPSAVI